MYNLGHSTSLAIAKLLNLKLKHKIKSANRVIRGLVSLKFGGSSQTSKDFHVA